MRSLASQAPRWTRLRPIASSRPTLRHIRHFHPTRPAPFLHEVVEVSSAFLHGVHSVTGLPWVASIPLTAFIVRMAVALPLQVYSRIHARRDRDISPLILSWRKHYQDSIMARNVDRQLGRNPDQMLPAEADALLKKSLHRKLKEVRKRWGVARYWKVVPFMQVPIWLSLMEGLRAMCGNNNGLIAYFLSFWASKTTGTEQSLPTVYEPSLAAEGALWFPDLLAGDPTGVLPIMLSTSILLNVGLGWKTPSLRQLSDYPGPQMIQQLFFRVLKSGIQCMAIYVGLSAYMTGMPTGLMIYWITSANVATLQSLFLDKSMFAIKPLKPWMKMHVGVLRPGEVKPPLPSSRE